MNMQQMMAQAQKMQKDLEKKKDELNKQLFPGKSEFVEVTLNGKRELTSIKILKDDFNSDDKEIIEDMIIIAMKDATAKIDAEFKNKMGQYSGMLDGLM